MWLIEKSRHLQLHLGDHAAAHVCERLCGGASCGDLRTRVILQACQGALHLRRHLRAQLRGSPGCQLPRLLVGVRQP